MATGGTITTSGGYTIHTFTSSGTFTPAGSMDVDMLIVAPGAGGSAGGAGAGGAREIASIAVTAQGYTITCAGYGLGKSPTGATGLDGGNSSGLGYTNEGGGGAGYYNAVNGRYGGSGGGPGGSAVAEYGYGAGVAGQGNRGGYESAARAAGGWYPSGGGGGWGAASQNCVSTTRGAHGGAGASSSYSGAATNYAGGGGGGCKWSTTAANNTLGGIGGGGAGKCRYQGAGGAGTHYLGGGGGGCGYGGGAGGRGGYGVIVIRYLTGADEGGNDNMWLAFNFAFLVGLGFLNTIRVRFLTVAEGIKRNGLIGMTKAWVADINRFGFFWKQRYIKEWKRHNGLINPQEIFDGMRKQKQAPRREPVQVPSYSI